MDKTRGVDFLFTGLAVVPGMLLFSGHPGPALLLFVPLLIGACLAGMYEQQTSAQTQQDAGAAEPQSTLTAAGHWRKRLD
ncbi:MAG: hypothetical protein KF771_07825 [Burkholderiales bacterium]|nr:hypothetical protein [Burkholderiales bacterium]